MGQEKGARMWAQPSTVLKLRQSFRVTSSAGKGIAALYPTWTHRWLLATSGEGA